MTSKEKLEKLKLNIEENKSLNDFIGTCVRRNNKFQILTNKATPYPHVGIQEVYNANTEVLIEYAKILDKKVRDHVGDFNPLADAADQDLVVNGVIAKDLLVQLRLIIREKTYVSELNSLRAKQANLNAQLEDAKSPEEKKADINRQLQELAAALS